MEFDYLPFTFDELPVKKQFELAGLFYSIQIQYNEIGEFFTFYIYDDEDNILLANKLVYGHDVLSAAVVDGLPDVKIVPFSLTDAVSDVKTPIDITPDNFGSEVKLYLV